MNKLNSEWNKIKDKIYYWDGSWRDIYILNIDKDDWMKWVNYVNQNYIIRWYNGKTGIEEDQINFKVIDQYLNGEHDLCSSAKIFIGKIQINCHFFSDTEIENDIDPREISDIEDHKKIIQYMSDLSFIIEKEVILSPESDSDKVLIKVDKNVVSLN